MVRSAIDREVAVADQLAGLGAAGGEAHPEHDVVQTDLEQAQQVLAGHARPVLRGLEVAPELALQDAVHAPDLLLLAQLHAVLGDLPAAHGVLSWRGGPALEAALLGIAAAALEEELHALPTAEAADGSVVASHGAFLDPAPLRRAAAVVGDGSDVRDGGDLETGGLQRPDGLLPTCARTLHEDLDLAHAVLHRPLGGAVGTLRGGVRACSSGSP